MIRILPSFAAVLAACSPAPQETAMRSTSQGSGTTAENAGLAGSGDQKRAAVGPAAVPVSAAENPAPAVPADSPAEAEGRRTLSTAFVRVGPDGHLTVELQGGRVLVLRDVVMNRKDYCGVQVRGGKPGARYCGGYSEVAAARPGGAPVPREPDLAAPNPLQSPGSAPKGN